MTLRARSIGGVLVAVLATGTVCLHVLKHWQTYEMFDKFFAVAVLLALAAYPWFAIRREQGSGKGPELYEAYILILLVSDLVH